jgi:hypothetical protein
MTNLPTKRGRDDATEAPSWQELRERFRHLLKDIFEEGKEIERELEPRLVPILNRLKDELEAFIAKLEQRARKP